MTGAYYNEHDAYAAAWLRNLIAEGLIAPGEVDERSIVDVRPGDLDGFAQAHLFAGIGGWSLALRLAGWPDGRACWTGSCPCQPFSNAGKRAGTADERHLWPEMFRLVKACRPPVVFGEQVASGEVVGTQLEAAFVVAVQGGHYAQANKLAKRLVASRSFHFHPRWLDGVRGDLETEDYAFRHAVLGAHSVGAPHIRQRLWWVADAQGAAPRPGDALCAREPDAGCCSRDGRQAHPHGGQPRHGDLQSGGQHGQQPQDGRSGVGLADTIGPRLEGRDEREVGHEREAAERGGGAGIMADSAESGRGGQPGRDCRPDGRAKEEPGRLCDAGGVGVADGGGWSQGQLAAEATRHGSPAVAAGSGFWSDYDLIPCRDGKARRVGAGIQPLAHGVPVFLERVRAIETAGLEAIEVYGAASQRDTDETLRMVRQAVREAAGREEQPVGVRGELHAPQVLLDFLLCLEAARHGGAKCSGFEGASEEVRRRIVRGVRSGRGAGSPSCGRQPDEQRRDEPSDALLTLSLLLARLAAAHRQEARNAYAASDRVGKLRAAGNAIVPQAAAAFIQAFDGLS